jgi:hypothetical protein
MFKLTIAFLKIFAFFVLGLVFSFPISAMCGALSLLFACLPLIWEILWRSGLGLMMITAIALFIEGWNNGAD